MISFVYFDIGGVLIKDFSARPDLWKELKDKFKISDEYWEKECSGKFDIGIIPKNLPVSYDQLLEGFVSRFEKNSSMWPIIDLVKNKVRIGLLTNMYPKMFQSIVERQLLPPISWEIVVDSTAEKLNKPNREIFEVAQNKANTKDILFIDNDRGNLVVPESLGWKTFYYDSSNYEKSSEELKTYFSQIGLF